MPYKLDSERILHTVRIVSLIVDETQDGISASLTHVLASLAHNLEQGLQHSSLHSLVTRL
jgi:hypothetical protein